MKDAPMTRYYFDLRNEEVAIDDEGVELANAEAAQTEAARSLTDLARDAVRTAKDLKNLNVAVEVRDDAGPVMRAELALQIKPARS